MPTHKFKPEPQYPVAQPEQKKRKKTFPTVSIPVSSEIIAALKVGGEAHVVLKGTVRGLEWRQSGDTNDPWSNRNELRMELRLIDAEPGEALEDDEAEPAETTMQEEIEKGLGYLKGKG